jgi:hypothetical protein
LADAAFFSGGSLTPSNCPAVPPRDDLTAMALAGALLMASVVDPLKKDAVLSRYLALGHLVTGGQMRWG